MSFNNDVEKRLYIVKDVIVTERSEDGLKKYIIKNPVTNKYYVLGEAQYKILNAFDGVRNINEVTEFLSLNGLIVSKDKVEEFSLKLRNLKLLIASVEEVIINKKRVETQKGMTLLQRLLFIRITLVNPSKYIAKLLNKVNFIFSTTFLSFMIIYVAIGFGIYLYEFSPSASSLITDSSSQNVTIVISLYLITIFASIFHETAHALTCLKFGGMVEEMGFLIIYFRPGLYCNISDTYLFKEKKHRIYVSLAGIILDFIVWSTIIVIGYLLKRNGINPYFMPAFGIYGLLTILLELNPLIKLDGYYALTEILGIYNLRENSFRFLNNMFTMKNINLYKYCKENRIYFTYALFAGLYSSGLIIYTFYVLFKYLILKLNTLGVVLASVIVIVLFSDILIKAFILLLRIIKCKQKIERD